MPWASFTYFSLSFLHGSVDFCFVWLCYNLLELCRLFRCMHFFFFGLWIACKRVWLGFWWCACVLWSQKFGKIADNYFSIIDVRLLRQKKERENHIIENWSGIHLFSCSRICVLKIYFYVFMCFFFNFFCVYISNIFWVLILNLQTLSLVLSLFSYGND